MSNKKMSKAVDYFYNEKGDYTITLFDEPIGLVRREEDADKLKRYFSALTMRIDVLQRMNKQQEDTLNRAHQLLTCTGRSSNVDAVVEILTLMKPKRGMPSHEPVRADEDEG